MKSWKTTLGGVAAILGGLGVLAKMVSTGNFDGALIATTIAAIGSGFTGLFARDNNVSSEAAGAK